MIGTYCHDKEKSTIYSPYVGLWDVFTTRSQLEHQWSPHPNGLGFIGTCPNGPQPYCPNGPRQHPNKRWYLNHIVRYKLKCHTILQHRYEQNTMINNCFDIYVINRLPGFTVWWLKFTQMWRKYGFSYIVNTVALPRNVWLMNAGEPPRLPRMASPGFLCS